MLFARFLFFSLLLFRRFTVRGELLLTFGGLPSGFKDFLVSQLTSLASPEPVVEARGIIQEARLLLGEVVEGQERALYPEAFVDFVRLHLMLMHQVNKGFRDLLMVLDSHAPDTFR